MELVCKTCLSTNRAITPVKSIIQLLNSIDWLHIKFNVVKDCVCWECEAILHNIYKFQKRALKAQEALSLYKLKGVPTKPLSQLVCQKNYSFNISNIVTENCANIKLECDLEKNEPSMSTSDTTNNDYTNSEIKKETDDDGIKTEELTDLDIQKENETVSTEVEIKEPIDSSKFIINIMSKEELEQVRKDKRSAKEFQMSIFKCSTCIITFTKQQSYIGHMDKHSQTAGDLLCGICSERFTNHDDLSYHEGCHYLQYQCKQCLSNFKHLPDAMSHHEDMHTDKVFVCKECGKVLKSRRRLRYHRERDHRDPSICERCDKQFKTITSLRRHIELMHTGSNPSVKCDICGKEYKQSFLAIHKKSHELEEQGKAAYCADCDKQFVSQKTYATHLKEHSAHRNSLNSDNRFVCTHCNKWCPNRTRLKRHIDSVHLKEYPFGCHLCDKKCDSKTSVKLHIKEKHEGVSAPKNKICSHCGRGFKSNTILKHHLMIHTGERPYHCDMCPMKFRQKYSLVTHIRGKHLKNKTKGKVYVQSN